MKKEIERRGRKPLSIHILPQRGNCQAVSKTNPRDKVMSDIEVATYKISGSLLQSIADNNFKICALSSFMQHVNLKDLDQSEEVQGWITAFMKTAGIIHELSDKIYETLKQIDYECDTIDGFPTNVGKKTESDSESRISFTGGTHNHHNYITNIETVQTLNDNREMTLSEDIEP